MQADKILDASAKFAEALKNNPSSEQLIYSVQLAIIFFFSYMMVKLIVDFFKKSRMERMAEKYESTLSRASGVMERVVSALETIGNGR